MNDIANSQPAVIPIWPDGAPGSEAWTQQEQETILFPTQAQPLKVIRNVTRPTLTAFLPDPSVATGTAFVVCPGGAFHFLSINTEGMDVARWLNARGVAAFVLRYRLIQTSALDKDFAQQADKLLSNLERHPQKIRELTKQHEPLAIADGQRAIKVLRARAAEWSIARNRIGIMGFSAGGTVTFGVALHHDVESRPDAAAAIAAPYAEDVTAPADAPPLFVLAANDDPLGRSGSVTLFEAWKAARRSVERHIYAKGGHAFSVAKQGLPIDSWIDRFSDWLQRQGLLRPTG